MATYYSDNCSTTTIVQPKTGQETITVVGTYTVTANLAASDVIQMVKVPANAIIQDVIASTSASIAGTSTCQFGDGADTDRFISSGGFGSGAAALSRMNAATGHGYQYTADDTIDLLTTTQTTPVTGAVIKLSVQYYIP